MHTSGMHAKKSPIKEPYYTQKRPTDICIPQVRVPKEPDFQSERAYIHDTYKQPYYTQKSLLT